MTTPKPLTREDLDAIAHDAMTLREQGERAGLSGVIRTADTVGRLVAHVRALEADLDRWKSSHDRLVKDHHATLREMSGLRTKLATAEADAQFMARRLPSEQYGFSLGENEPARCEGCFAECGSEECSDRCEWPTFVRLRARYTDPDAEGVSDDES